MVNKTKTQAVVSRKANLKTKQLSHVCEAEYIDRNLRPGQAAEMLGITPRHCSRLLKRYRQSGPLGMNNQNRGRTGNRLLPASLTDQALNIIRERYADFGPTLAREKLAENHGIVLGKETLRRLMIKTGLWVPRKQRAPKIQQPRYRRACCGELIQIDGCDHHWFDDMEMMADIIPSS